MSIVFIIYIYSLYISIVFIIYCIHYILYSLYIVFIVTLTNLGVDLKNPYRGRFVDVGKNWGLDRNDIWTVETGKKDLSNEEIPLVLVHGFGAGVGIWALNLDSLSNNRKVYAFDVLGFGRSSRPKFDKSEEVEWQIVQSFEWWRREVGLEKKFILLGHSFGAYLALSYALHFPDKIAHLILADPWGIPSQQQSTQQSEQGSEGGSRVVIPMWARIVARLVFKTFSPLSILRAAGPWGPALVHKTRPDIKHKFQAFFGPDDADLILDYIYHCNAQDRPSGEVAFKSLTGGLGWAKFPMIQRIADLHPDINLTFIYGARSWIDRQPALQIKCLLSDRSVDVHVIQGAGHHVYADKHDMFNDLVNATCREVEERTNPSDEVETSPRKGEVERSPRRSPRRSVENLHDQD